MKNKKCGVFCYIVVAAFIVGGIIMDIRMKNGISNMHFFIECEYKYYVFSAMCTIAVLGCSFFSIIVNVSTHYYLGLRMDEIVRLKGIDIPASKIMRFSLISVIAGLALLLINFTCTLAVVCIIIVVMIMHCNIELWEIMTDLSIVRDALNVEITRIIKNTNHDSKQVLDWINRWINGLEIEYEKGEDEWKKEYYECLTSVRKACSNAKSNYKLLEAIDNGIICVFRSATENVGMVKAFEELLYYYDFDNEDFYEFKCITSGVFDELQYCNEPVMGTIKGQINIEDIVWELNINEEMKEYIVYKYFQAVEDNTIISDSLKRIMTSEIAEQICGLGSMAPDTEKGKTAMMVRRLVIRRILKKYVLDNSVKDKREMIYKLFLEKVAFQTYDYDKSIIEIVAECFRAIFLYAYDETELLGSNHRKELKQLLYAKGCSITTREISLPELIKMDSDRIVMWLSSDATCLEEAFSAFEFFPGYSVAKTAVWNQDNLMEFAFAVYCALGYSTGRFPCYLFAIQMPEAEAIAAYKSIINCFEENGEQLRQGLKEKVKAICQCIGVDLMIPNDIIIDNFNFYNQELIRLNGIIATCKPVAITVQEYNELLINKLEQNHSGIFNKKIRENVNSYRIRPRVIKYDKNFNQTIAQYVEMDSVRIFKELFDSNNFNSIEISYDLKGIKTMKRCIKDNMVLATNYLYTEDWAFSSDLKNTPEFVELNEMMHNLKALSNEMGAYLLTKKDDIGFNIKIIDCQYMNLSSIESDNFLKRYEIADGLYRLDDMSFNRKEAIAYVDKAYRKVIMDIDFFTNFDENDVIIIRRALKHKRI